MEEKSEFETLRFLARRLDEKALANRDNMDNAVLLELQKSIEEQYVVLAQMKERLEGAKALFQKKKDRSVFMVDEHCLLRLLTAFGKYEIKGDKQ